MIQEVYHKALRFFSSDQFDNEFLKSRIYFFQNSHVLDESSPQFFQRNQQFLDWYFFSRPLEKLRLPPSHCVFMFPNLRWSPEEVGVAERLKETVHSLFEIRKISSSSIQVFDLFDECKLEFRLVQGTEYFIKGQLFDGRYLKLDEGNYLFAGRCFHPEESYKFLKKSIEQYKDNPDFNKEKFLLLTLKMRYLYDRHSNARLEHIYSFHNRWFQNEEIS
ncbi:MAG: hypothetical protein NZ480_00490 [Bdellovibrionaceae bacterium]|nr:hypothetical protein [Pseudobdellovibrionaceae bacterium]MDW8190936.1 hypothetical protein [Pseudobdellovibrionaceae bacterium]